jgi:hypothetical protein
MSALALSPPGSSMSHTNFVDKLIWLFENCDKFGEFQSVFILKVQFACIRRATGAPNVKG